jgi:hypothetical protein
MTDRHRSETRNSVSGDLQLRRIGLHGEAPNLQASA